MPQGHYGSEISEYIADNQRTTISRPGSAARTRWGSSQSSSRFPIHVAGFGEASRQGRDTKAREGKVNGGKRRKGRERQGEGKMEQYRSE